LIHHLAITPKNFGASHEFYTEVMGFTLVKIVKRQAMGGATAGWTKHVFYDTGHGSYFVLWDLHLTGLADEAWQAPISTGLGLPWWVNHIAFEVAGLDELEEKKQHWLAAGKKVSEVVHETGTWWNSPATRALSTRKTSKRPAGCSPTTPRPSSPTTRALSTCRTDA
jgi:catechol 2,3-dioxygenase-like lactoylglutathione lyase family enzyme